MKLSQGTVIFEEDTLTEAIRREVRSFIERIVLEELAATLGAGPYQRTEERQGYRHGFEHRQISTSLGRTDIKVPRGRLFGPDGETIEWQSHILPRYQRRAKALDDAILGIYLCGANTRRIKQALRPLLKGTPLSKSSISCLVLRLKEYFESWRTRALHNEFVAYLYLDGFGVTIRSCGRVCRVPVLAAVGVNEKGEKILLGLWLRGSESAQAWQGVIEDLVLRGLPCPELVIIDGNQGLRSAIELTWPKIDVQRCVVHKLRNLLAHAPKHASEAIKEDFHAIVYASGLEEALLARDRFVRKWKTRCEGVVKSLKEAGNELLTFFRYPQSQWKSLRSTNIIERLYGEFRRRIKTQASLPSEHAVLIILFGLFASGQICLRRLSGWRDMPQVVNKTIDKVA
ncbi:MAG: IS256 family transposase [candidate division WOR-3 bacterium]